MKKLLMVGDAGCRTGFARVVKGVADHLHSTGQYDIAVRGINYRKNHGIDYDYDVQAISYDPADPLCAHSLGTHIEEVQPDVVWLLSDLWNLAAYAMHLPQRMPTVMYYPVDTPCMKWSYSLALGAAAEVATYTHFGARESAASVQMALDVVREEAIEDAEAANSQAYGFAIPRDDKEVYCRMDRMARWQNPSQYSIIPHGLDTALFRRRGKADCRRAFGLPEDGFIVTSIGTNQFRKRLDITVRAFAEFLSWTDGNAWLVFHCHGGDLLGWDLAQLTRFYGVQHRTACVHFQFPTLSDDDLCTLYNVADVNINTSGGEGWGLCSFESAACGVPQLVPNWGGQRELWKNHGTLLPVRDWRHEPKFLNTAHGIVDAHAAAVALHELYRSPSRRHILGTNAFTNARTQKDWREVGEGFDVLLQRALGELPPSAMSFNELLAQREAQVYSEIQPFAQDRAA